MKIVFLNTLNGSIQPAIGKFIKEQSVDTDIFCFQEARDPMQVIAAPLLINYTGVKGYKYTKEHEDFSQVSYTQVTYIESKLFLIDSATIFEREDAAGLALYTHLRFGDVDIHICNVHGISQPGNKLDDANRLRQSSEIITFFKDKEGLKIIGGDFNLLPETESIRMFEVAGYKDLIKTYNIQTTRNRLIWEKYPNSKQYHSDYVFVSQDVRVKNFTVPDIEVSDHLPMILEIE